MCIDMACGGESWAGWRFGKYGRAREWRLHAPNGCHYVASEVLALRAMTLDLDYLQQRVNLLETLTRPTLTDAEVSVIHDLQRLLERLGMLAPGGRQRVANGRFPGATGQLLDFKKPVTGQLVQNSVSLGALYMPQRAEG